MSSNTPTIPTRIISALKDTVSSQLLFVRFFSLLGIITLSVFGFTNLLDGGTFTGSMELLFAAILSVNLVLISTLGKRWLRGAKIVMMICVAVPLWFLLSLGGIGGTGVYWYFTYPVLAFLLWERSRGWIWMILLYAGTLIFWLMHQFEFVPFYYRLIELRQLITALTIVAGLLYIFRYITDNQQDTLKTQKVILSDSQIRLEKALAKAEHSENLLRKRTHELEDEKGGLEDTRSAMLNVVEDLELEKKKLQQREQELAEAQKIGRFGSFVWDVKTNHVTWSDESFAIHGWQPTEDNVPPPMEEYIGIIHPEDREIAEKSIAKALKLKKENSYAYRVVWPDDGSLHWVRVLSRMHFDEKGKPSVMKGTFQDVTTEMEVDKAKTEFVSLASHQLRTPLSTINWYSEMLLSEDAGPLTDEQTDYLKEIYRGNQRMVELVNSLLNVSRLELGTFMVEPEEISVVDLCKEVVHDVKQRIENKNLSLTENYDDAMPIISTDRKLMHIIIENLLTNAIKYTNQGGDIAVTVQKKNTRKFIIEIKDTGMGIPEGQQNKIFTKLFRADNVRTSDTDGTGLGLYLTKSIVDYAKGKISFTSKEGKGTTFTVELPLSGMKRKKGSKKVE